MATFRLYFDTDNASFEDNERAEIARILRKVADRVESPTDISHYLTIFDANGNDIGRFALKGDE